jgi:hypothetical protein
VSAEPFAYRGELNEFDVLGVNRERNVSEDDIQKAIQSSKPISIKKSSSVLLIQSGAAMPDAAMATELAKYFNVIPFSGVPTRDSRFNEAKPDDSNYSKTLRLAAARGGNQTIICYWGTLETSHEDKVTKTVSWIPIVGWGVPDEREHMRIKLKIAVIDVATGNWSIISPTPFESSELSSVARRERADQALVNSLKQKGYQAAAAEVVRAYLTQ